MCCLHLHILVSNCKSSCYVSSVTPYFEEFALAEEATTILCIIKAWVRGRDFKLLMLKLCERSLMKISTYQRGKKPLFD